MSFTITQITDHLDGMGHGAGTDKITNIDSFFERVGASFLTKVHPLEAINTVELNSLVHDQLNDYQVPYDFGAVIDLYPDDDRELWDQSFRTKAGQFDREKAFANKTISVEAQAGEKILRINWKSKSPIVLNTADSLTANGTWSVIGGATGLVVNTIYKKSGNGSLEFDLPVSGGGIQNTTMTPVDLSTYSPYATNFVWVQLGSDFANLTSITPVWGNDLTTNFWTGQAITTQADGQPFRMGWNQIEAPWTVATQTGAVNPILTDSYKLTFQTTAAMQNVRVDNILFSLGRAFDLKYYSKYIYQSATTGNRISIPDVEGGNDLVLIDNDLLPHFLMECLIHMSQQMQGSDGGPDINFAQSQLQVLFPAYKAINPPMIKKATSRIGNLPRLRRSFWNGWGRRSW